MARINEKVFFFSGSGNRNLFAFLHHAESVKNSIGVVYCHPFAEEKNMSHSIIVKAARMIAEEGFPVFRFDLSGCGDSEGDLDHSTVEDWRQDLDKAIEIFHQETGVSRYLLWGLRLGAGLALMREQYSKDDEPAGLILWQPVLDFSLHIEQFLRRSISSQILKKSNGLVSGMDAETEMRIYDTAHVIGYPITKHLYNSFNEIGDQPLTVTPSSPTLIVSVSLLDQPAVALKQHADRLRRSGTPVTLCHVSAEPFWDRYWQWECKNAAAVTLQWIKKFC
ncbi:hypothetical protein MNBD_DELTA04-1627 [hydrothermal vent metagenome]|uniref:Serine aminopeptidase S33 domain-containing protein n=1 Tax=hydrothermal vent metagenome TaxID=652676 RepID=A0A3B0UUH9_9ZZZZ